MTTALAEFSLIILIVLAVSCLMRLLKQPLIIGYIISGILAGPLLFDIIEETEILKVFSELGISFLLFLVGLHLAPKIIREVGKISLVTGLGQIVFTSLIGYGISILLGFSSIASLYIAVALTFSSTIIIMKLLSDKDDLEKLYGKISIGFLLVQDFSVVIALMVISSLADGGGAGTAIILTISKGFGLILLASLFTKFFLVRIEEFLSGSQELLFIFVIVWGLGLSFLFSYAGLSMEIGALIAGVLFATTPYHVAVTSKLKPLRDFFLIFFFIILGSQMTFPDIQKYALNAVYFSLFILVGNPLIVMILMGLFGYSKKTGFKAGLTVAQISEFSLIFIALGIRVGHIPAEILSFVTIIGLLTISGSTYLILYSDRIYGRIQKYLSLFEKRKIKEWEDVDKYFNHVLIGYNRTGFAVLRVFQKIYKNFLVVDFNPGIIKQLKKKKVPCAYGDADDTEFLDAIKIHKASTVISTVPDVDTNIALIKKIREKNHKAIIIVTARQIADAFALYRERADYVIIPHLLGGLYISAMIEECRTKKERYAEERDKNIKELKERIGEGLEEPSEA